MNPTKLPIPVLILALLVATVVNAQSASGEERQANQRISLSDLITATTANTDRQFLVDVRAPADVVVGPSVPRNPSYGAFLSILRNNGLAAVTVGGITSVIPVDEVRQFPLPEFDENDSSLHDEEWVTHIIVIRNARAQHLIPILRPLLPKAGHLAAHPDSSAVLIVDRAGNVRRVTELIARIDELTPPDIS